MDLFLDFLLLVAAFFGPTLFVMILASLAEL